MSLNAQLVAISNEAAGQYFIVTDKSAAAEVENDTKLRLIFINTEKGVTNTLVKFKKGDTSSLTAMFGNQTRAMAKKGNFSIRTCIDALKGGNIGVVNLRPFDNTDLCTINAYNIGGDGMESAEVMYTDNFNTRRFWRPDPDKMFKHYAEDNLISVGVVDNTDKSIVIVKAAQSDIEKQTSRYAEKLTETVLNIEAYPALDVNKTVGDYFVTVYVFNQKFSPTSNTNQYYGHLFDNSGNITDIAALTEIAESGFAQKYTGCIIPETKNESDTDISIDNVVNADYANSGVILAINDDILELSETKYTDLSGKHFHDATGVLVAGMSNSMLSHVVPSELTKSATIFPLTDITENVEPDFGHIISYGATKDSENSFLGSFEQGIRYGDKFLAADGTFATVTAISILDNAAPIAETADTFTSVKITTDKPLSYSVGDDIVYKLNNFTVDAPVKPVTLTAAKLRAAQFCDGTAAGLDTILDVMNQNGITRGLSGVIGLRYIVDAFKSFVSPSYKSQYGVLVEDLNKKNTFVNAILNDIFTETLESSNDPLFADLPNGEFDLSYLPEGGNKTYTTKFLSKFSYGADKSYMFSLAGDNIKNVNYGLSGIVSNVFVNKAIEYDIAANTTGVVDGITMLEENYDDGTDRKHLEKFRCNPVIFQDGVYMIYGNTTMKNEATKQQQIQNAELLTYLKRRLFNLAKPEPFKRGSYANLLTFETEAKGVFDALALEGIIEPDFEVICNPENNTRDIANAKIKYMKISYTPINALEKVVFDMEIN